MLNFKNFACIRSRHKTRVLFDYFSKFSLKKTRTTKNQRRKLTTDSSTHGLVERVKREIRHLYSQQPEKEREFVRRILVHSDHNYSDYVFATTREFRISDMTAIGFDYDYTIANYSDEIKPLIYNMAMDYMIKTMKYPAEIREKFSYDPNFAIRGLTYDKKRGNLLKIDYLHNVQLDAVYCGRQPLSYKQIIDTYGTIHISLTYYSNLRPMVDNFSLPEVCLISDTIAYFHQKKLDFDPGYIYADVTTAVSYLHLSGELHKAILNDLPRYLFGKRPLTATLLQRLKRHGKKLFLLTNSPWHFVDKGMSYILDSSWLSYFDIVIVSADKPTWFTSSRHFRKLDPITGTVYWDKVHEFLPNHVYVQGSIQEFNKLTGLRGYEVLYFGDHLIADLREPNRVQGWRTGVIISELKKEIEIQRTASYTSKLKKIVMLQDMRRKLDILSKDKSLPLIEDLTREINLAQTAAMKHDFNQYFGSVFRTYSGPTLFAYLLQRYADVYTSAVENFVHYPIDFTFTADRIFLPHEMDPTRPKIDGTLALENPDLTEWILSFDSVGGTELSDNLEESNCVQSEKSSEKKDSTINNSSENNENHEFVMDEFEEQFEENQLDESEMMSYTTTDVTK